MLKRNMARKISFFMAVIILAMLLMPAASYAALQYQSARFYYNPANGSLSGTVYLNDPSKVKVTVTDSTYKTMDVPFIRLKPGSYYDDKNNKIRYGDFSLNSGVADPWKVTVAACNKQIELIRQTSSGNTISYESGDDFIYGTYRGVGKQHYTDYPAGSNLPAGAKLVEFTANVSGAQSLLLELPTDHIAHTSVVNSVYASDYKLTDVTVSQAVYVNAITGSGDQSYKRLNFDTRDGFVQGHQYKLELSDSSDGNEITQPSTGNYTYTSSMWLMFKQNNVDYALNQTDFKDLSFATQTTDGTAGADDGGSPFGDMSTCGGSTSSDSSGSGAATPPDDGVKDGKGGVELGNSAATVTKVTDADGKVVTKVVLDGDKLGKALGLLKNKDKGAQTVSIAVDSAEPVVRVELPASALSAAAKDTQDAIISIKTGATVYDLPLKSLDLEGLAKTLGADLKDVKVKISIEKLTGAPADQVSQKLNGSGLKMVADAVDFSVSVEANGKVQTIDNFGNTYVTRTLSVNRVIDPRKTTAILFDPLSGEIRFVPAEFITENGQTQVRIKRTGNSIYTVAETSKTFSDLGSHWAKADIELLASKLLVNGRTDTAYAPEDSITRAEFAALIVRALGLSPEKSGGAFPDVQAADWYAGSVAAAVKAGVVNGFENGAFRPNDTITREQMAVMVSRALAFAGKTDDTSDTAATAQLSVFKDQVAISGWARASVAQTLHSGIVNGNGSDSYAPQEKATRAQAAVMLKRMLAELKFIN